MGHSTEVDRINTLRDERGYFVRVIRRRPIDLKLDMLDSGKKERVSQTGGLYVRSELEQIRRMDGVDSASFSGRGGCTVVRIESDDAGVVAEGVAECRRDEPFSKRQGLRIALGRAEKDLGLFELQEGEVRAINAGQIDTAALDTALAAEVMQGRA